MSHKLLALLCLLAPTLCYAQEVDPREDMGCRTMDAAVKLQQAMAEAQNKKPDAALKGLDEVLKAEPQVQLARFWRAMVLVDVGRMDEAIGEFKATISIDAKTNVATQTEVNLGLLLSQLRRSEEGCYWFSRAVLDDPMDRAGMNWAAYRNMAITLHQQGQDMSAVLAVLLGRQANPKKVEAKMLDEYSEGAQRQEAGRVLVTTEKFVAPTVTTRPAKTEMSETPLAGEEITHNVSEFLSDPAGGYVIGISDAEEYYLVRTAGDGLKVEKVAIKSRAHGACLREGRLFLAMNGPSRIVEVAPETGKELASYSLNNTAVPESLAVLKSGIFFPGSNGNIMRLDPKSQRVSDLAQPGMRVAAHPTQEALFAYINPEDDSTADTLIIDGRPVTIRRGSDPMSRHATMFKYISTPERLLLAEIRENAGVNSTALSVSPDGKWVAQVSGGGWRSQVDDRGRAYVIPVLSADNLGHIQVVIRTDAYPCGCAFNPVTGQIAAMREQELLIFHLSSDQPLAKFSGNFGRAIAWSGNGRYLLVATQPNALKGADQKGLTAYKNTLSAEEAKLAGTWWKTQAATTHPSPTTAPAPKVIDALKTFTASDQKAAVTAALDQTWRTGSREIPVKWHLCSLYADTAATKQLSDIVDRTQSADAAGVRAYQLRQVLETTPNDPVLLYHLADAQRVVGQDKEGEANYLAALHNDAGRTNLSQLALVRMAEAMTKQGREMQAIHCLAAALSLDVDCPTTNRLLLPLLEKNGFPEQAQKLKAQATSRPSSVRGLPGLTSPDPKATALAGDKLYAAAVESVVLVERGDASGSGVCVARGVIVTNDHVISGRGDIRVTPFQLADGKLKRLEAMTATVLYESQELDVAVLEVKSAPASLKPLPVATANPKAGEKIYALGSPGLGDQVLEQSISEGLVSAPSRTLEGRSYLQHSAAINPGNSGGPLLNQRGEVVGINTLVAKLNNVGFAIPPEVIRKVFQTK